MANPNTAKTKVDYGCLEQNKVFTNVYFAVNFSQFWFKMNLVYRNTNALFQIIYYRVLRRKKSNEQRNWIQFTHISIHFLSFTLHQ